MGLRARRQTAQTSRRPRRAIVRTFEATHKIEVDTPLARFVVRRLLFVALLLLFTGCAHQPAEPPPEPAAGSEQTDSTPLPPGYDSETLSDLLVAEVAAQRQALGVTLGYYGQAANTTGDPTVIRQAAQLASYLEDHQQAPS